MPALPASPSVSLRTAPIDDPSENGRRVPRATPAPHEDYSIYVGALVPIVGRPVAIVPYRRTASSSTEGRYEAGTYCAFFTHEHDSFSSALCQRSYQSGAYPRLGAKKMIERGRDEAELALGRWLAGGGRMSGTHVAGGPLEFQLVSLDPLYGLYVFSPVVRACVQASLVAFTNERLTTVLSAWTAEVGVNIVPLDTTPAT